MKRGRIWAGILTVFFLLVGGALWFHGRGESFERHFDLQGTLEEVTLVYHSGSGPDTNLELTGDELEIWRRELASWRIREEEDTDVSISSVRGREVLARLRYPEKELIVRFQNDRGLISVMIDDETREFSEESCVVVNWRRVHRRRLLEGFEK